MPRWLWNIPQVEDSATSQENPCQCTAILTNKKSFLLFGGNFTEGVSLTGTAVGHAVVLSRAHGMELPVFLSVPILVLTHWKEPGSVLFPPFREVFINTDEIPLYLFSGLRSSSSLSFSLQVRCSSPFNSLMDYRLLIIWPLTLSLWLI